MNSFKIYRHSSRLSQNNLTTTIYLSSNPFPRPSPHSQTSEFFCETFSRFSAADSRLRFLVSSWTRSKQKKVSSKCSFRSAVVVGLPRNSEAKAATKQNYDTKNTEKDDSDNVPVNKNRLALKEPAWRKLLTTISDHEELPSPAKRCSRVTIFPYLHPSLIFCT